jgi:hypothetical protein
LREIDVSTPSHHDAYMKSTLKFDSDVTAKARLIAKHLGKPFETVINSALRIGLDQLLNAPVAKPYRTKSHPMGLKKGFNYDNIGELLAQIEGEDYR